MANASNRITHTLLVLVLFALLAVVGMLATRAEGGPLDPAEAPASTMKTLDEIAPVWSRKLPADDGPNPCNSTRFQCVLQPAGVLDRETGLVWEASPDPNKTTWLTAIATCHGLGLSGRGGWRIPTIEELRSLVDGDTAIAPLLSPGHPFNVDTDDAYWSATSADATNARAQQFDSVFMSTLDKSTLHYGWCVRGGQGDGGH